MPSKGVKLGNNACKHLVKQYFLCSYFPFLFVGFYLCTMDYHNLLKALTLWKRRAEHSEDKVQG